MYDAIYVEGKGKPAATYVFEHFYNDSMSAASSKGMPVIRVVPETIVSESTVKVDIEAAVKAVFKDVVAVLTKPLTADEKAPKRREPENPPRLIFKGTLAEVNQFFYQRGWTDGLPIIPPTEEAVKEMMTGTDLPADHIVEKLEPRLGKATIEKIAINAVIAGCLPTYMPLLIAGVQALVANPACGMMAASTGSFAPFWLVNGPIAKDINVRSTYGATNPGDIANASFGRAMGLITKNVRGIRKQIEDMGVLGNPGKYSWVAAENEENSPWEPLHVERGFKKEDSAVTLMFPQSFQQMMPFGTDDKGILATIVGSIAPARMGSFAVLLTPTNAKSLADGGWSKKAVKKYIVKNTIVPDDYYSRLGYKAEVLFDRANITGPGIGPQIFRPSPRDPDPVQVFVFGGFGSWMGFIQGGPPPITKKVELPKNWAQLVKKYKNVVPNYARY
ncbi:MAG: hypothetical protein A2Z15_05960 [Chloroflexi bacterium RBG_16_50_11]|nr:MAG: hypothetical protein A2Z15_05960 [Chloroflexi bacterium RBG_16_50_11]